MPTKYQEKILEQIFKLEEVVFVLLCFFFFFIIITKMWYIWVSVDMLKDYFKTFWTLASMNSETCL